MKRKTLIQWITFIPIVPLVFVGHWYIGLWNVLWIGLIYIAIKESMINIFFQEIGEIRK